jgi:hypothetical protein
MTARCLVPGCGWRTEEPVRTIAGCLATWHVYEAHPDVWKNVAGNRPPLDPDPRDPAVHQALAGQYGLFRRQR